MGGFDAFDRAAAEASRLAGGLNLKTIVYKGAVRGGCRLSEHKRLLGGAQIASGNLCRIVTKDRDGDVIERKCEHYDVCTVIEQRRLARDCDVIFMPHAFLSLPLPKEITDAARGLIIDEAVWSQLVKTTTFPASALTALRPMPRLTNAERNAGIDPGDLVQDRESAAEVALAALKKGQARRRRCSRISMGRCGLRVRRPSSAERRKPPGPCIGNVVGSRPHARGDAEVRAS